MNTEKPIIFILINLETNEVQGKDLIVNFHHEMFDNKENEPRLRTVVFRGWHKDSSMIIFTDRRSEKSKEYLWVDRGCY